MDRYDAKADRARGSRCGPTSAPGRCRTRPRRAPDRLRARDAALPVGRAAHRPPQGLLGRRRRSPTSAAATGYRVLHPMGYDAFGLPAENHAIKTGRHPRESTEAVDRRVPPPVPRVGRVDRLVARVRHPRARATTAGPSGSSCGCYEKRPRLPQGGGVNWCPKDATVLANEQVIDGRCERCGTRSSRASSSSGSSRSPTTPTALLDDLEDIDWPAHVVTMQKNWIGRSEGAEVVFRCDAARQRLPGLHHPPRHAVRRHLLRHGARAPGRARS